MFARRNIISTRERAAVVALMARNLIPWNSLAGEIEDEGGALALLLRLDSERSEEQLFAVENDRFTLDELEEQVHRWEDEQIELVTVLDDRYPVNLRMIHNRPAALFVRGALQAADERSVAVVGTRRASEQARALARTVAAELVAASYVVVSGLAAGIDTAAHHGTLEAGGRTVAVIGTGLRENFPKENIELQARLAAESAVVSQFWPGQGPRKWTFPQRNAVMSGLARATVVVEASHTSGARMQARLAREHGRPVFLMRSLLEHDWARKAADDPGAYVVDTADEIVGHLDRLYSEKLTLSA